MSVFDCFSIVDKKGLSIAFDLPTQLGLDADDPLSEGEVGKVGVSISMPSGYEGFV